MRKIKQANGHIKYIGDDVTLYYNPENKTASIAAMHAPFKCTRMLAVQIAQDITNLININPVTTDRPNQKDTKKIRENLYYNNGVNCCYVCDEFMEFKDATLEHIIPLSLGGGNKYINYSLSHYKCNTNKGSNL